MNSCNGGSSVPQMVVMCVGCAVVWCVVCVYMCVRMICVGSQCDCIVPNNVCYSTHIVNRCMIVRHPHNWYMGARVLLCVYMIIRISVFSSF